jgi:hypothetical protein
MAIRHTATVVCDYLIKADDGRHTLVGIFRNIHVAQFPAVKDPLGIYVEFTGTPGDEFEIVLASPGSSETLFKGTVGTPKLQRFEQATSHFSAVAKPAVFKKPGVYRIILKSKGRTVHSHPFGVFQKK